MPSIRYLPSVCEGLSRPVLPAREELDLPKIDVAIVEDDQSCAEPLKSVAAARLHYSFVCLGRGLLELGLRARRDLPGYGCEATQDERGAGREAAEHAGSTSISGKWRRRCARPLRWPGSSSMSASFLSLGDPSFEAALLEHLHAYEGAP